jgi:hypothetical protein
VSCAQSFTHTSGIVTNSIVKEALRNFRQSRVIYFEAVGINDNLLKAEKEKYQDLLAAGSFILNLLQTGLLARNVRHE